MITETKAGREFSARTPRRRAGFPLIVVIGLALLLLSGTGGTMAYFLLQPPSLITRTLTVSGALCGFWQASIGAELGGYDSRFYDVASVTANNIWAVGDTFHTTAPLPLLPGHLRFPLDLQREQPLIAHWDGTHWNTMAAPDLGSEASLQALAVAAPNDIWAVGVANDQYRIIHWDGTRWSLSPTPPLSSTRSRLNAVAAFGSQDVWAVGDFWPTTGSYSQALMLHWDGSQWQVERNLPVGGGQQSTELTDVTVLAAGDVWAVGTSSPSNAPTQGHILHWNGANWRLMLPPDLGGGTTAGPIVASAPNEVWVFGSGRDGKPTSQQWNGQTWRTVPVPPLRSGALTLLKRGVARSAQDVWVVGGHATGGTPPVAIHWDGRSWEEVPSPAPAAYEVFSGVTAAANGEVWAVGGSLRDLALDEGASYALVAHFIPQPCAAQTPSPVGTP